MRYYLQKKPGTVFLYSKKHGSWNTSQKPDSIQNAAIVDIA